MHVSTSGIEYTIQKPEARRQEPEARIQEVGIFIGTGSQKLDTALCNKRYLGGPWAGCGVVIAR
jgi:hypothetical protein